MSPCMNYRELRDFVRATLDVQKSHPDFMPMNRARAEAARLLGVTPPSDAEFKAGLAAPAVVRRRGRPPSGALTKRDAVAAVAVYFEAVGAGAEQSITLAKRWLGVSVSRKVAKVAISEYKVNTSPEQIYVQAQWAYLNFRAGTVQPLPAAVTYTRKKRAAKFDLG